LGDKLQLGMFHSFAFGLKVTVMSDDFTPNLTSDGSGGLWEPYAAFGTDPDKIK